MFYLDKFFLNRFCLFIRFNISTSIDSNSDEKIEVHLQKESVMILSIAESLIRTTNAFLIKYVLDLVQSSIALKILENILKKEENKLTREAELRT